MTKFGKPGYWSEGSWNEIGKKNRLSMSAHKVYPPNEGKKMFNLGNIKHQQH